MLEQVVHQGIHVPKDTCNLRLNTTENTPIVALIVGAVGSLLLDVALGQKDPTIVDARL